MLSRTHLLSGLNALSRAHATNYFADGHRGAAMVSAYYLCAENQVEDGVADLIAAIVDEHWTGTDLFAAFPDEKSDAALLGSITEALSDSIGVLRQAGHNVIFASLALKAFHALPETVTPQRVEGVRRLIQSFRESMNIPLDDSDDFPDLDAIEGLAAFALREYLRTARDFIDRGQGWTGHMLTFGKALVDLHQLGYVDLARQGHHAFRQYVKRTRMGPQETDGDYVEHPETGLRPLQRAYWETRKNTDPGIGHSLKYPYGFYGLVALVDDDDLKRRCLDEAFRVF